MEKPREQGTPEPQSGDRSMTLIQMVEGQTPLAINMGQQPTLFQFPGQSYLLLTGGQQVSSLQGINVVRLDGNNPSAQPGGAQTPVIQVNSLPSQGGGVKPSASHGGSAQPHIFQLGGLQPPGVQTGSMAQILGLYPQTSQLSGLQTQTPQTNGSKTRIAQSSPTKVSVIQTSPAAQSIGLQPQTVPTTGLKKHPSKANDFQAQTFQAGAHQFSPAYIPQAAGHHLNPENLPSNRVNKQPAPVTESRKKTMKKQPDLPVYVDVGCHACNLVKTKNSATNTLRRHKSVGTQTKAGMRKNSQSVQIPEVVSARSVGTYQESSTQADESCWGGSGNFQNAALAQDINVMVVDDPAAGSDLVSQACKVEPQFSWDTEEQTPQTYLPADTYTEDRLCFDDVAVYFNKSEWEMLNDRERRLYEKVMTQNYRNLQYLGRIYVTPPVISRIEQGEEPCMKRCPLFSQRPYRRLLTGDVASRNYILRRFSDRLRKPIQDLLNDRSSLEAADVMSKQPECPEAVLCSVPETGQQCPASSLLSQKPNIPEKPFRCVRCERRFTRFCGLILHQKAHQTDNSLACFACGKNFKSMKHLLRHEMIHTGERPFVCSGCGKGFICQQALDNHLGVPAKKKLFPCSHCDKSFASKYGAQRHELTHNPEDKFVCSFCGKCFVGKTGFMLHQRIHTGANPYACSECGVRFNNKSLCIRHQRECAQPEFLPPESDPTLQHSSEVNIRAEAHCEPSILQAADHGRVH